MQSEQMFGLLKARARRGNADLMWLVGTAYRDGHFRCIGRKWEVPACPSERQVGHALA